MLKKATWKHWVLFLLLTQGIYLIMMTVTIPRIQRESGGLSIFDMRLFGYTYEGAVEFLTTLSVSGYWWYQNVQIPLDILFPLLNGITGFVFATLILRKSADLSDKKGFWSQKLPTAILLGLPILAAFFDYCENIMVFTMLSASERVSMGQVAVSNFATLVKSIATMSFYLLCCIVLLEIGLRCIQKRRRFT